MTYTEIVKNNMILPFKKKYTLHDVKALIKKGYNYKQAAWLCICSCIFYDPDITLSVSVCSPIVYDKDKLKKKLLKDGYIL